MARIQILELPTQVVGEFVKTPFALVIDQVESEELRTYNNTVTVKQYELTHAEASELAKAVGAAGYILTGSTLDVTA